MKNLGFEFAHSPWWLLLLIPAVVLTLIPYFRLSRKYRRTRNRITSIVLHLLVMLFTICLMSGMILTYEVPNDDNEIILLVDVSDTEEMSAEKRDEFVQTVLDDGQYDNYKIGVVTFGFNQVYAVPMTYDVDGIYNRYAQASLPDTSATDIASALTYAKSLFEHPKTAKIVLITDGKETDGIANDVVRSVAAQGIKLDVAYISSSYEGGDVQLVEAIMPDYYVRVEEECSIQVTVNSQKKANATIVMTDKGENNEVVAEQTVELSIGSQNVSFTHVFEEKGFHQISFAVSVNGDPLEYNNELCTYYNLEIFNKVLIVERTPGESDALIETINYDEEYEITKKCILDEDFPKTLDELRQFDQVILNNISNPELKSIVNADTGATFDVILQSYVSECGGGLLTVGGNDEDGNSNVYDRSEMYGSVYQDMLPIQAVNYTPPVGVIVIVDTSGSMSGTDEYGKSKLDWAIAGAESCLEALTERDYFGLMTLDSYYSTVLPLTPCTQTETIINSIHAISGPTGGTIFTGAIIRAAEQLRVLENVARRHIIIVSDGAVPADEKNTYPSIIEEYYKTSGITLSVVGVNMKAGSTEAIDMQLAVDCGHGELYIASNTQELVSSLRKDLTAPEIKDVNFDEPFYPVIYAPLSPLVRGLEILDSSTDSELTGKRLAVSLGGFYGGKIKTGAELILTGDYEVPIYAQWSYGAGTVGSFMCDLNGEWSADFMANENGKAFLKNAINYLMPTSSVREQQLRVTLSEDNYTNKLSVYSTLNEGEYITGQLIEIWDDQEIVTSLNEVTEGSQEELAALACYVTLPLQAENKYSRCNFVVKASGIYKIVLTKYDAEGNVLGTYEKYKNFSYSEEYDTSVVISAIKAQESMQELASRGNGVLIEDLEDPYEIFEGFDTDLDRTFDPRLLFMSLAIVLFLLDIAVRKFKFKWPHEIIRDIKNKKNSQ